MKECKKEISATIVLLAIFCFMLFLYEPIVMYMNNTSDFWFDFSMMMGPVLIAFFLSLSLSLLLALGLLFILKKKNKVKIYHYVLVAVFFIFFYCYIQGNFLAGFLPVLDGSPINWNALAPNLISIILAIVFVVAFIILVKKKLINKSIKIFNWATVAILIMLIVSLIPMMMAKKDIAGDVLLYPTTQNLNLASTDKNLMILVVDAVDSRIFNERLSLDEENKNMFRDFTYYPDALSAYPFTRESMPMLLTGEWYESQEKFDDFSTKAYNNSKFLNKIYDDGYDINIYSDSIVWRRTDKIKLSNWSLSSVINPTPFIKQELKYILFKYLPYPLKRFSKIESFDMGANKIAVDTKEAFIPDDLGYYRNLINNPEMEKQDKKMFSFVHIDGAHIPFNLDSNLNWLEQTTYEEEIDATIKIIAAYLKRLKDNGVYDNSAIIVTADHGYNPTTAVPGRQNPILYIKGIDEHHSKMKVSDRPVSEAEYIEMYLRLLDGESGDKVFGDEEYPKARRYLEYLHTEVNHLREHEQRGKAWDLTTMIPTGVEYNR